MRGVPGDGCPYRDARSWEVGRCFMRHHHPQREGTRRSWMARLRAWKLANDASARAVDMVAAGKPICLGIRIFGSKLRSIVETSSPESCAPKRKLIGPLVPV